jgi:hypothetical protein
MTGGWLDARGHTHSEALHLTERFHRLDFGHMEVNLTIDNACSQTPICWNPSARKTRRI